MANKTNSTRTINNPAGVALIVAYSIIGGLLSLVASVVVMFLTDKDPWLTLLGVVLFVMGVFSLGVGYVVFGIFLDGEDSPE